MPPATEITLRSVSKTYHMGQVVVHALREIDLQISAGELLVVRGPSGSGKTTLLNLIGGLDIPSSGKITVGSVDIAGYDEKKLEQYRRMQVGFIFQFFNLLPTLTARENVEFALELVEVDRDKIREKALELLGRVGLDDRADHFPGQLSGGEQQRVAIARALSKNPSILLADEPTGNLDLEMGRKVLKVIQELSQKDGRTVIIVTHNAAIAAMAQRVVHLRDGRIRSVEINKRPLDAEEVEW